MEHPTQLTALFSVVTRMRSVKLRIGVPAKLVTFSEKYCFLSRTVLPTRLSLLQNQTAARVYKITFLFDCLSNCHEMGADPSRVFRSFHLFGKHNMAFHAYAKEENPLAKRKDISFDPSSLLSCINSSPSRVGWAGREAF